MKKSETVATATSVPQHLIELRERILKPPYDTLHLLFTGSTAKPFMERLKEHGPDPEESLWVCSPWANQSDWLKPEAWFDIHRAEIWSEQAWKKPWHRDYQGWLRSQRTPIVMMEPSDEIKSAIRYPYDDVKRAFPDAPFAGTTDWMMALAILLGVEWIGMWGMDYCTPHELLYQRFGLTYWLGFARGRGIEVELPDDSSLLKNMLLGDYGPSYPPWPALHHPQVVDRLLAGVPRPKVLTVTPKE